MVCGRWMGAGVMTAGAVCVSGCGGVWNIIQSLKIMGCKMYIISCPRVSHIRSLGLKLLKTESLRCEGVS